MTVAVDKLDGEVQVADLVRPTDELLSIALPQGGEEVCAWLSTQGPHRLCFSTAAAEEGTLFFGRVEREGGGGGAGAAGQSLSTGMAAGCCNASSLPPLLPMSTRALTEEEEEEDSIQLGLHAVSSGTLPQDGGFGCAVSLAFVIQAAILGNPVYNPV